MRGRGQKSSVFWSAISALILLFATQGLTAVDPDTAVGVWLFNEEVGNLAKDLSENALDAKFLDPVKWTDGKFDGGLEFKSGGLVDAGISPLLNVGKANFSMVAWFKYSKTAADWHATLIEKADFAMPRHGYLLCVRGDLDPNNKGKPLFWFGLAQGAGVHLFGISPINDGKWHHLAATADRKGAMKLYRDGKLEAENDISAHQKENEDNHKPFTIGGEAGVASRSLTDGTIDEVALFNVVLTEDQITEIAEKGLARTLGAEAVSPNNKLAATWGKIKMK
jgi:hypothetical protein